MGRNFAPTHSCDSHLVTQQVDARRSPNGYYTAAEGPEQDKAPKGSFVGNIPLTNPVRMS